ncbi:MAG: HAD family hydrolase [Candidatus Cloacimonadota bacterium]|nr:HAD family hydrolase [Candidatus Cloacimonadota bacterium]
MIKAIIWDYDGTLVDTHIKNLNVTRKIIEHISGKKSEDLHPLNNLNNYRIVTKKAENWRTLYKNEFNLNENEIDEAGRLWSEFQLKDETEVPFYNGITDVIQTLNKYPHGIVSQNSRENIRQFLQKNKILKYFKSILGYEEVETSKQKPEPDGLLRCISELVPHKRGTIIYIGDHETDIRCAINANKVYKENGSSLKVISIGAFYDADNNIISWEVQPDFVAEEVEDISEIIETVESE